MNSLPSVSALNVSSHISIRKEPQYSFSLFDFLAIAYKSSIFYTLFLLFTAPVE